MSELEGEYNFVIGLYREGDGWHKTTQRQVFTLLKTYRNFLAAAEAKLDAIQSEDMVEVVCRNVPLTIYHPNGQEAVARTILKAIAEKLRGD